MKTVYQQDLRHAQLHRARERRALALARKCRLCLVGFVGNAHILALCSPSSDQGAGTGDVDHDDFFLLLFVFDVTLDPWFLLLVIVDAASCV